MPEVVDWRGAGAGEVKQRAVERLCAGGLVAFPTDTMYEVGFLPGHPEAQSRLGELVRGGDVSAPLLTLAVRDAGEMAAWVPGLSNLGRRLARQCWPGPVTLLVRAGSVSPPSPLWDAWPGEVREKFCRQGQLAFRSPGHDAVHQVLQGLAGPLILNETPTAATAQEMREILGDREVLIIDDGPTQFGRNATVVRVEGSRWEIVREGPMPASEMEKMTPCRILFVCTGNTCRSPMAEALCRKLLADRLGCAGADLPARGYIVQSAGLAAVADCGPAADALTVTQELGADLTEHRSRPLTLEQLAQADFVFTMTRSHLFTLVSLELPVGPPPRLLSPQGEDIPDPIGQDAQVYRECARQILRHLEERLPELQAP